MKPGRQRVAFFGATGTMGSAAFARLLELRDSYSFTVLLRPGERAGRSFERYAREARLRWAPPTNPGGGHEVAQGDGLTIVWGDARDEAAVSATVAGAEWVLNTMAVISPAADYRPELARSVNDEAVGAILRAIEAEPDGAERIGYVHTGTVAQTGSRPPGVHVGRIGDPLNPSVFDAYALTKIAGERRVMESPLEKWVSLRMSFIMPTDHRRLMGLLDPIAFHMPLNTRMESVTDRDAATALINCLQQPSGSPFWRRAYNIGGGPGMRTTAIDYLATVYGQMGLDWQRCTDRDWFALRNFHLQYYEDSAVANQYLQFQHDDEASFMASLEETMPAHLKALRWLLRAALPVKRLAERVTRSTRQRIAEGHRNSPRYWYLHGREDRLDAFFGGRAAYEQIGGWSDPPDLTGGEQWTRLDHGYDEGKTALGLTDLQDAAGFRGGECLAETYSGDPHEALPWRCGYGHDFLARPVTVLHGGHWCPVCVERWNGGERARVDHHFAEAWYADHAVDETREYGWDGVDDIADADLEWRRRGRRGRQV